MKKGFTLAEVLITLGIIGVVAAVTLPTLVSNTAYHQVGVKLSKFMTTTQNAAREFVIANGDFSIGHYQGGENLIKTQQFANFIMDGFNFKKAYFEGTELDTTQVCPTDTANSSTPLTIDTTYAIQNDDTLFSVDTYIVDTGAASSIDTNLYPEDKYGTAVATFYFDPNVRGLPSNGQHVFAFAVTTKGYMFPEEKDGCLREIINQNWNVNPSMYRTGGACDKTGSDTWTTND